MKNPKTQKPRILKYEKPKNPTGFLGRANPDKDSLHKYFSQTPVWDNYRKTP